MKTCLWVLAITVAAAAAVGATVLLASAGMIPAWLT